MFVMAIMHAMSSASGYYPPMRRTLAAVDLNLLPILEALLEDANVSRAARRVGLSQSALSHALARLRDLFDDPLLVRSGSGMTPTPLAVRLRAELGHSLDAVEQVVRRGAPFDPALCSTVFRIRAVATELWLTRLNATLRADAPEVTVQVVHPPDGETVGDLVRALGAGDIGFAFVSGNLTLPATVREVALTAEAYQVIARADHPAASRVLTVRRYLALQHVLVAPRGDRTGVVDIELAVRGATRRIAVVVPSFADAGALVASSDLIATLPASIARQLAATHPLRLRAVPIALPPNRIRLVWHDRLDRDPAATWFRCALLAALPATVRPKASESIARDRAIGPPSLQR